VIAYDIRGARDGDAWDLIGVIAECWAEFPGCVMDVHAELPEMLRPASHYEALHGRCWVADRLGRTVGMIALSPTDDARVVALQKLYVAHVARGKGLGATLVDLVEEEARRRDAVAIELWSDTRFAGAHRLYERLGYARAEQTRQLQDLSNSVEYHFRKELGATGRP
jgi:putative acetyltransferase